MTDRQQQTGGEDLDAFLTVLESKLRGPFSSLDLAKTITTNQLRGPISQQQYLQNVGAVLGRAEKITQLRVLIGLLGLDPSTEIDDEIHTILSKAQIKSHYVEEWVRVISGLVHGIMFYGSVEEEDEEQEDDDEHENYGDNTNNSQNKRKKTITTTVPLRGDEADDMLDKTCAEIIERIRKTERMSLVMAEGKHKEEIDNALALADADPTLAPYRYALLQRELLEKALPEVKQHKHFQINDEAEILTMDAKLEAIKAQEEYDHALQSAPTMTTKETAKSKAVPTESALPILPGLRQNKGLATGNNKVSALAANRPKSNLFMPKKPMAGFTVPNPKIQQTALKIRKAGAAQDLLKSKKSRLMMGGGTGVGVGGSGTATQIATGRGLLTGTSTSAQSGRAMNRFLQQSAGTSKMKMLDMNEVQGLEKEKLEKEQQQQAKGGPGFRKKLSLMSAGAAGQKRKAPPNESGNNDNSVNNGRPNKRANTSKKVDNNSFADMHDDDDDDHGNGHGISNRQNDDNNDNSNNAENDDVNDDDNDDDQKPIATPTKPTPAGAALLATAALNAYQAQLGMQQQRHPTGSSDAAHPPPPPAAAAAASAATAQQSNNNGSSSTRHHDWKSIIKEKSNKLSSEDRFRVQQFFVDRYNPTPHQMTYKMKLHEERTTDPKTGQPVKETYYLELDYNTFTSKQSKKTKRY